MDGFQECLNIIFINAKRLGYMLKLQTYTQVYTLSKNS